MERLEKFFCDLRLDFQDRSGMLTESYSSLYPVTFLFSCHYIAIVFIKEFDSNNSSVIHTALNCKNT